MSEILARVARGGVSVEAPFELVNDGLSARIDAARPAVVRAYLSAVDPNITTATVARVKEDLAHLQAFGLGRIGDVETRLVHEDDWAEKWKENFPVQRVGRRIVIQPSWRQYDALRDDVVIKLDPGIAFGTGLHPTTRLCLAGLERWSGEDLLGDARVLDVGTGSGVLAIAAAVLGASYVLAIDTDPLAVETASTNAQRNGHVEIVEARRGSLPLSEPAEFHLVVANLIAGVLIELAAELRSALRPGGRLLAGGIIHEREQEVGRALASTGLRAVDRTSEGDWLALEFARPA